MIRVVLPAHLRTLAQVDREVMLRRRRPATLALGPRCARSSAIPSCAGRSAITSTLKRRPFISFFACEHDLSHDSPEAPLPRAVATGAEPFLVVGAMAGG